MQRFIENQSQNMFLWTPFLMAVGCALYFSLNAEPNKFLVGALCVVFIVSLFLRRHIVARAGALFIFGVLYAAAYTHILATPQITRDIRDRTIIGVVKNIDYTDTKTRLSIQTDGRYIDTTGAPTVRVSISDAGAIRIGDTVRAVVNLYRPNAPYADGAFNYARWAYFNHLTATGYIKDYEIISHNPPRNMNAVRDAIHNKSNSFLVDSLVLGYKNAVPRGDSPTWTATGVGHVWSISGFHMTLVGGWLFVLFYSIFRLIAPITRRVPARVPATICAWVGLGLYLFLSGCDVATMRAFLMTTLIFAAVVFGRSAISLRNVCVAMWIIILINPHYVMQAGFQLSFAAIFGLIWFWGVIKPKMPENKILKVLCTAALTSIVATIFTAPFVIAHFGAFPLYSLIGNLVLLPIFSIAIMPLVILGTVTAMLGWHAPLTLAATIYGVGLRIAHVITDLPYASLPMPHMPNAALIIFIVAWCALMFICGARRRVNYIFAFAITIIGVIVVVATPRPVFYATPDHELVGFVENGKLKFNKSRASNHYFAFDTWKQINGESAGTPNTRYVHAGGVYTYRTPKFTLVYIQKFVPLMNNIVSLCNDENVDYIVSYFHIDAPKCANKILHDGGIMLYPSGRVKYLNVMRPWNNPQK
ncbi:MAG: ComEC/Rec2 family competence protein [Pseudomonadota bacterium]|nr:ComEC/Rec2 family competence protein [Pseudomonadota bacterium]